jgi:hypothetical protein
MAKAYTGSSRPPKYQVSCLTMLLRHGSWPVGCGKSARSDGPADEAFPLCGSAHPAQKRIFMLLKIDNKRNGAYCESEDGE